MLVFLSLLMQSSFFGVQGVKPLERDSKGTSPREVRLRTFGGSVRAEPLIVWLFPYYFKKWFANLICLGITL